VSTQRARLLEGKVSLVIEALTLIARGRPAVRTERDDFVRHQARMAYAQVRALG